MKKIYILFFLLPSVLVAQDYISMFEEGNSWNVVGLDGFGGSNVNISYTISGEEIINNITYIGISGTHCKFREDGDKVYGYNPFNDTEHVIYDFTLEVGDVINFTNEDNNCKYIDDIFIEEMTVVNKTEQFLAGENRIVLELEAFGNPIETWMEGIGSTTGFYPNGNGIDTQSYLTCFTNTNGTYYFNDYNECIILGVDEFAKASSKIYPNPITVSSVLEIPPNVTADKINIYDIQGKLISAAIPKLNQIRINAEEFESGFYFYQVLYQNRVLDSNNFIIQ